MRKWKVVTANVLTFQPAVEKEAAGFFASGRRLEFEECIANLNVGFGGIQEGRQRSSVTRQVGRYFVGCLLPRTRQPHVHSCAPTDAMMFGSGHFQDHRAVVLDFSTVEMTGPQVARQYRTAICDRQLLLQESVQCSLQQWWQAHLVYHKASPRIKVTRSWRSGCVVVSAPWHHKPRKSRSNHGWIALRSIKCSANPLGDGSASDCNNRCCASRKSSGFLSGKWVLLRSMLRRLTTLC